VEGRGTMKLYKTFFLYTYNIPLYYHADVTEVRNTKATIRYFLHT